MKKRIIVGISGASGAIYGIRTLEILKSLKIETHLVITKPALLTINQETKYNLKDIKKLADYHYNINDIGASIASGSFKTDGMIVVPCSICSMSEISTGITSNLLTRSADVTLKERRRLVLAVREMPFHTGHLRSMLNLSEIGAIIAPPLPAFYQKPKTINDIIDYTIGRLLSLFDIETGLVKPWSGLDK